MYHYMTMEMSYHGFDNEVLSNPVPFLTKDSPGSRNFSRISILGLRWKYHHSPILGNPINSTITSFVTCTTTPTTSILISLKLTMNYNATFRYSKQPPYWKISPMFSYASRKRVYVGSLQFSEPHILLLITQAIVAPNRYEWFKGWWVQSMNRNGSGTR
jgi:hypothetical protein